MIDSLTTACRRDTDGDGNCPACARWRPGDPVPSCRTPIGTHPSLGLDQDEWWTTRSGQRIRVRDMTDTHRLHTARMLLNKNPHLEQRIRDSPLYAALLDGLPTPADADRWDDLIARTRHWSTCPRNRDLGAPACDPTCPQAPFSLEQYEYHNAHVPEWTT